jgi:hypothetical protein
MIAIMISITLSNRQLSILMVILCSVLSSILREDYMIVCYLISIDTIEQI